MRPFEYLFLRQMKFDYISPPICEALFSSTGEPTILLETFERDTIQGLELYVSGDVNIRWRAYPGALCYSVYQADGPEGPWVVVAECIEDTEYTPDPDLCYTVTVITPEGESDISEPICPDEVVCPEWDSDPGGSGTLNCGDTLTLVGEASLPAPQEGDLVYTWVKTGDPDVIVQQETKSSGTGPSTFIINDLEATDAGTYLLSIVYTPAEGEPCELTTAYTLYLENCGGGGCSADADTSDPPSHFLIKLGEDGAPPLEVPLATLHLPVPTDAADGGSEIDVTIPAGKSGVYLLRYTGGACGYSCDHSRNLGDNNFYYRLYPGAMSIMRKVGANWIAETEDWIFDEWTTHITHNDAWGNCGYGNNYYVNDPAWVGGQPTSEAAVELVYYSEGSSPTDIAGNLTFAYEQGGVDGQNGNYAQVFEGDEIKIAFCCDGGCGGECGDGSGNGLICNPDGCCGGALTAGALPCVQTDDGNCTQQPAPKNCGTCNDGNGPSWEFIRWGYWLEEPDYIRIKNYAAFVASIDPCEDCTDSASGEWDGTFHIYKYDDDTLVYGVNDVWADVALKGKRVDATTSWTNTNTKAYWFNGVWYLDIYCVKGGGNQLLWRGKKLVGKTAVGTYNRDIGETMCYSAPSCLEIEEYDPYAP